MIYTVDDGQLLSIWAAITQISLIREMPETNDRSILLTRAQALLTAFVLELNPLPHDRNNSITPWLPSPDVAGFDA
jgi:hypothetical protein